MSRKTEYSKEFKEEAIRLCKAKEANKAEIARKLGLNYKTICNWVYASSATPTKMQA
ncbi:MAG: transposase [Candidatus Caenarcaniphilales bacterium]|nr:transposase [Candidatus Caenarcaniphilales bacterium]